MAVGAVGAVLSLIGFAYWNRPRASHDVDDGRATVIRRDDTYI